MMHNGPVGLFDKIDDTTFRHLLSISNFEKRHGVKATHISVPEELLERWEKDAGAPITEIREWPVEGGPFTEVQVTFDNGWIRPLHDVVQEVKVRW